MKTSIECIAYIYASNLQVPLYMSHKENIIDQMILIFFRLWSYGHQEKKKWTMTQSKSDGQRRISLMGMIDQSL